jgi:hypothetical protein
VTFSGGTNTVAGGFSATDTTTFSGGTTTFSNTPTVNALVISGGEADFNSTTAANTLTLSSGTLGGTGTLTVSGPSTWSGGYMEGGGTAILNGSLGLSGTLFLGYPSGGYTLDTNGTTTWTGNGTIYADNSSVINNSGTWQDQNAGSAAIYNFGGTDVFNNTGTYQKTGAGTTTIGIAFNNTGLVNVQAGTLAFSGNNYNQTAGTTLVASILSGTTISIKGGVLEGSGTVNGNLAVTNATVLPGAEGLTGTLTINGTYANTGTLAIDILNLAGGPGTGYSQLYVTGTGSTLGGTLQINLLSGAVVNAGEQFDIFDAPLGYTGTFASITGNGASLFTEDYTGTDVFLDATSSSSVPLPPSLLLLGPGLAGLWLVRRRSRGFRHGGVAE